MVVDAELFGDPLPTYLSRFIGRQCDLTELVRLSRGPRLTICGAGGAGKTRLAVELARRLRRDSPGGADAAELCWVELASVANSGDVPAAVAAGLGLRGATGPQATVAVVNALRERHVLLVLDNCEHLAASCARFLDTLSVECPDVAVIATSRVALGTASEQVYPIPPLGLEARELFVERAAWSVPAYALTERNADVIEAICRRLDGLPLAIELIAGWVRLLSPWDLLARLEDALEQPMFSEAVAERHRSMRTVLEGTWQCLDAEDRSVLAALGVFSGGFRLEAAEAVADASLASLATLVDSSLIQRLPDAAGGTRFHIHELVRVYALGQLRLAGRADVVQARHFDYYLQVAQSWAGQRHTLVEPRWDGPVAVEQGNLDAALTWALERQDAERALRVLDVLGASWVYSVPRNSSRVERLDRALALPWTDRGPEAVRARAKALSGKGHVIVGFDAAGALSLFRRALEFFTDIGDEVGVAASVRSMGWALLAAGDLSAAERSCRQGLEHARRIGDSQGEAWSWYSLGAVVTLQGDLAAARTHLVEALRAFERNSAPIGRYRAELALAEVGRLGRKWAVCLDHAGRALELQRTHHFTTDGGDLLELLALTAGALQRLEAAAQLSGAAASWRVGHDETPHLPRRDTHAELKELELRLGGSAWKSGQRAGERLSADAALEAADHAVAELTAAVVRDQAGLTAREVEVLRLVAEGLANDSIADRLVVSPRTVHAHLRSIFDKLRVTSRTAAAREAVRLHLA